MSDEQQPSVGRVETDWESSGASRYEYYWYNAKKKLDLRTLEIGRAHV